MSEAGKAPGDETRPDQDAMDIETLARGVLAREFRPRVATVRRLAEAVLNAEKERRAAVKQAVKDAKKKSKAAPSAKSKSAKGKGKKRKLARIPGQAK